MIDTPRRQPDTSLRRGDTLIAAPTTPAEPATATSAPARLPVHRGWRSTLLENIDAPIPYLLVG